jgi:hypothetical protein
MKRIPDLPLGRRGLDRKASRLHAALAHTATPPHVLRCPLSRCRRWAKRSPKASSVPTAGIRGPFLTNGNLG